jgi:outer membrane biosynthesis protein TonB
MSLAADRLVTGLPPSPRDTPAVALAGVLHLLLILAASFGWHWTSRPLPPADEITPVDFVDIADVPRVREAPRPSMEAAPQETSTPEPAPPQPEPEPTPPPEPSPQPKPTPAPPAPAPKPLDTASLSNLINKALPKAQQKPLNTSDLAKTIEAAQPRTAQIDPRAAATLAQAIRAQVAPCWNPPIGGADVRRMTVLIAAEYAPDGSVRGTPSVVSQTGVTAQNNDFARAFAETARRAVLRCQPLKLPAELYPQWRSVEINFDPELMT